MSDPNKPYIERQPGQVLKAEDWNKVQTDIKQDIAQQIATAIKGVTSVDEAKNAHTLDKQTVQQLIDQIVNTVKEDLAKERYYRMFFKRLLKSNITVDANQVTSLDKISIIQHNLNAFPLADVYQLDYFKVLCASGPTADDQLPTWVNFYLYHSSEKRIRSPKGTFDIEPVGQQPYKVPFKDMLELFRGVNGFTWDDTTPLNDLETDFWKAFFTAPNDEFQEDQFCHSPWFQKAIEDNRTVGDLQKRGDWDDIWFQMRPRKGLFSFFTTTFQPQAAVAASTGGGGGGAPTGILSYTDVQVVHFDLNTLGIALLSDPYYPTPPDDNPDKAKLVNMMVLLKV